MNRLHVINPAAGKRSPVGLVTEKLTGEDYYVTAGVGDAERFVRERCSERPDTHIFIYGGDGTLCEVVNGVLGAGAGGSVHISVVPTGTGNDFYRLLERGRVYRADVMRYAAALPDADGPVSRYALNIINTGFDSAAAAKMQNYKRIPLVNGSMAYIMGVTNTLFHRLGERWQFTLTMPDGSVIEEEGEYMLALVANGCYYGGGFKAAPLAKPDDGLLDLLTARKISRPEFLALIAEYRSGRHIDPETALPIDKFKNVLDYKKCVRIDVEGLKTVCVDGEVYPCKNVAVEVVPDAITIVS